MTQEQQALHYSEGKPGVDQIPPEVLLEWDKWDKWEMRDGEIQVTDSGYTSMTAATLAMRGFCYIAGPYVGNLERHYTTYEGIDRNISEARLWAAKLARANIPFFCPHLNSAHFEVITPDVEEGYWLGMDLVILEHAAAVLMLPDWEFSSGAKEEYECAMRWGIPVFDAARFGENAISDLVQACFEGAVGEDTSLCRAVDPLSGERS